jgi:hypothetical protein
VISRRSPQLGPTMRRTRLAVLAFFLLYLAAVTWPGATLFARAEPFILGLPFSFFWPIVWIVLGFVVLVLLDRREAAHREPQASAHPQSPSLPGAGRGGEGVPPSGGGERER